MCKSSVYFIVPPIFGKGPLTSFGLATALLVACGYHVPTVFIETRDYKFSNTISQYLNCRGNAQPHRELAPPHRELGVLPSRFERWMTRGKRPTNSGRI